MAYLNTYKAYVRFTNGERREWLGLTKGQAKWRYHWIQRNTDYRNEFDGQQFDEFGWKREWQD